MNKLDTRLKRLEDRVPLPSGGSAYVIDIGTPDGKTRYWIDDIGVDPGGFERGAPRTDYVVDIGGDDDTP